MRYINNKKSGNGFILSVICLHVQIYQCIVCTVCIGRGSMRQVTITIINVQCSYYILCIHTVISLLRYFVTDTQRMTPY